jgi:hypothetical protein
VNNINQENDTMQTTELSPPKILVECLPITTNAKDVLLHLVDGPAFLDVIEKAVETDALAGTHTLLDAKLVDAEVQKHTNRRGKIVDRLLLTLRPVETWEGDTLFMGALGLRWA